MCTPMRCSSAASMRTCGRRAASRRHWSFPSSPSPRRATRTGPSTSPSRAAWCSIPAPSWRAAFTSSPSPGPAITYATSAAAGGEASRSASSSPRFLERTGWVIDLAQYRQTPAKYPGLDVPNWLLEIASAWLLVPIIAQERLIGFVVLATPRTKVDVNWEVLDLLKTAARQLGSFLAHIEASEALLEARKFEAFNKMGAFVV